MTKGIIARAVSITFATLCIGSIDAAATSQTHRDTVAHPLHFAHKRMAAMRAVPERPTVFPSARPQPYPYNLHETDGLSRNPNDCAVSGCIDNN
jgi:hypothetical protein